MQLDDATIRPQIEDAVRTAWNPVNLRPDAPRVPEDASDLPSVRVELLSGETQPTGAAAASRDVIIPHSYRIAGVFEYPASGTVNEQQVTRWNALMAQLTADYPRFAGWRYLEAAAWEFDDDAVEQTYSVAVTFTLEVISSAKFGG